MNKHALIYTNLLICTIILSGFIIVSIIGYTSSLDLFKKNVEQISKLTSQSLHSTLSYHLEQPVNLSLSMAHDTFLKKWLEIETENLNNPEYTKELQSYLASYKKQYRYDSVFFISATSGRYYHPSGIRRTMLANQPINQWYYDFIASKSDCAINVDNDEANQETVTVFINCKVFNENGNLLGIVGVGINAQNMQRLLNEYEKEYSVSAYFINETGRLELSSQNTKFNNINLFEQPPFSLLKDKIIKNPSSAEYCWYDNGEVTGYYSTKYVPQLNWYLIVEKNTSMMQDTFSKHSTERAAIIFVILVLVLAIIAKLIQHYNHFIMKLAESDPLTGLRNRFSYEQSLKNYNYALPKYQRIGIGVFDVNYLKQINDTFGHHTGDQYIKKASSFIVGAFVHFPVYRIGGDEFAIIFENVEEHEITNSYKNMLNQMKLEETAEEFPMQIAFGYAFFDPRQDLSLENVFARADKQMYSTKKYMKDLNE